MRLKTEVSKHPSARARGGGLRRHLSSPRSHPVQTIDMVAHGVLGAGLLTTQLSEALSWHPSPHGSVAQWTEWASKYRGAAEGHVQIHSALSLLPVAILGFSCSDTSQSAG